jgi:hypothetical protein
MLYRLCHKMRTKSYVYRLLCGKIYSQLQIWPQGDLGYKREMVIYQIF